MGQENSKLNDYMEFLGKVTANVTHELNNINSIINEYVGIIEDNLLGAQGGNEIDIDKLMEYKDKIILQLIRGKDFIKKLNNFAHSTDSDKHEYELISTISDFMVLINRLAKNKEIELKKEFPEREIYQTGNPFLLLNKVFLILMLLFDKAVKKSAVVLGIREIEENVVFLEISALIATETEINNLKEEIKGFLDEFQYDIEFQNYEMSINIKL